MTKDLANLMQSVLHLQRLNPNPITFDFEDNLPGSGASIAICPGQFGEANTALP